MNDFTWTEYADLIELTSKKYNLVDYKVIGEERLPSSFAIIRHDIDMSPKDALKMAEIEHSKGIRATYTVLLTGVFYNAFEKENLNIFKKILSYGHQIGLHYDAKYHDVSDISVLNATLEKEASVLSMLLENAVTMFSFHNTSPFTMDLLDDTYCGLYNAYCGKLRKKSKYTSDSNGYWIHNSWSELLAENVPAVHILTHPEWWSANKTIPGQKVAKLLFARRDNCWQNYTDVLNETNRKNVTGLASNVLEFASHEGDEFLQILLLWLSGNKDMAFNSLSALVHKKYNIDMSLGGKLQNTEEHFHNLCKIFLKIKAKEY